jgi:S1-C subfamily serine protease
VIALKLEDRPRQPNLAKRYYAEDLGFSVREMVFMDAYSRHLEPGAHGVLVALVRPQAAAQSARLEGNDMVVELNGREVKDLDQFKKDYEQFRKDRPKEAVVMVVLRDGKNQTIRIEPPQ